MSELHRSIAEIPEERRTEIRWLVLEHDTDTGGGWFLFLHESLAEPCKFDGWHPTRDEALREAERQWGVGPGDWQVVPVS